MLAAICIPEFSGPDLAWLQDLRARYDPEYALRVAPHVTVVFPNSALGEEPFLAHIADCARDIEAVTVTFSSAREYREPGTKLEFVFLIPEIGKDWFLRAHDRMNGGPLATERRNDIPYVPHITLARFASCGEAAPLTARINSEIRPMTGRIEAIDVVQVDKTHIRHLHREPLGRD